MDAFELELIVLDPEGNTMKQINEMVVWSMQVGSLNEIALDHLEMKIKEENEDFRYEYKPLGMELALDSHFEDHRDFMESAMKESHKFTLHAHINFKESGRGSFSRSELDQEVKIMSSRKQSTLVRESNSQAGSRATLENGPTQGPGGLKSEVSTARNLGQVDQPEIEQEGEELLSVSEEGDQRGRELPEEPLQEQQDSQLLENGFEEEDSLNTPHPAASRDTLRNQQEEGDASLLSQQSEQMIAQKENKPPNQHPQKNTKKGQNPPTAKNRNNLETVFTGSEEFRRLQDLAKTQINDKMFLNAKKNLLKLFKHLPKQQQSAPSKALSQKRGELELMVGFLKNMQGMLDESHENFQFSLEVFFEAFAVDSEWTGCVTSNIGSVFYELGDYVQALEFLNSAKTILMKLDRKHSGIPNINYNIGLVNLKNLNMQDALLNLRKAIEAYITNFGEEDLHVADSFEAIGETLHKMRIFKDSLDFFKKSLRICERILGKSHPRLAFLLDKLAITYVKKSDAMLRSGESSNIQEADMQARDEDLTQAELYLIRSLNIRKNNYGNHPLVADTIFNLSKVTLLRNKTTEAIKSFRRCCSIYSFFVQNEENLGNSESAFRLLQRLQVKYVKSSHTLVTLLFNAKDYLGCLAEIENLKAKVDKELIEGPILCSLESMRCRCLLMEGSHDEAYEVALKSVELFKTDCGEKHPQTIEAYFRLGYICKCIGKVDEAVVFLTMAMDTAVGNEAFVRKCQTLLSQID